MSVPFLLQQFGPGMSVTAVVAFIAALATRWLSPAWTKQIAFAVAAGGAFAAGYRWSLGWPAFPPTDATQWLLFAGIAGIFLGAAYGFCESNRAGRLISFGLLLFGTLSLILAPKFRAGWTFGEGAPWVVALVLGGSLLGCSIDASLRRQSGRLPLLWLLVLAGGASAALALSGSVLLGQLAGLLAAVVFGLNAASLAGANTGRAIVPAVSVLLTGLIACGYFYADLPWSSVLLLALGSLAGLFGQGLSSIRRDLVRAAIAGLPVAAAVALAFKASPPLDY